MATDKRDATITALIEELGGSNNPLPWRDEGTARNCGTHFEYRLVNRNGGVVATFEDLGGCKTGGAELKLVLAALASLGLAEEPRR